MCERLSGQLASHLQSFSPKIVDLLFLYVHLDKTIDRTIDQLNDSMKEQ